VHALNAAQCPLDVADDMLLAGTSDSTNLNVRPSASHPDPPVTPTRVHSVESRADGGPHGVAQGRHYSSRCLANRAKQPNGIHAIPRRG
jgi:hypothetical protein